jgi:hypothetical protein
MESVIEVWSMLAVKAESSISVNGTDSFVCLLLIFLYSFQNWSFLFDFLSFNLCFSSHIYFPFFECLLILLLLQCNVATPHTRCPIVDEQRFMPPPLLPYCDHPWSFWQTTRFSPQQCFHLLPHLSANSNPGPSSPIVSAFIISLLGSIPPSMPPSTHSSPLPHHLP